MRGVRPARSYVARYAIVGLVYLGVLERVYSWPIGLLLLMAFPYFREGFYFVSSQLFGMTLEPISECGRIPLGQHEDE